MKKQKFDIENFILNNFYEEEIGEEYKKLNNQICDVAQRLFESLSPEQIKLFEKFERLEAESRQIFDKMLVSYVLTLIRSIFHDSN